MNETYTLEQLLNFYKKEVSGSIFSGGFHEYMKDYQRIGKNLYKKTGCLMLETLRIG